MSALTGRGVAVTRAEPAGGALGARLEARGARVARWTTIALVPPADPAPFESALARLEEFDWLAVTSGHAVAALVERVAAPPASLALAAIGPATAAALEAAGWRVDRVGEGDGAEGLVAAFRAAGDAAGARVLYPASARARTTLEHGLAALGATVERVEAYRTLPVALDAAACRAEIESGAVEAVTFASPSALEGLAEALGDAELSELLARVAVASIGPTTSAALAAFGRAPDAEAEPSTLDGLVEAARVALAIFPFPNRAGAGAPAFAGGPTR